MNTFQWCPLLKLLSSTIFLSICFCCCLHSVIEHLITDLKLPLTLIKIYRIAVRIHANASDAVICSCWQHMHCGHSCSKNFLLFLLIGNNNWWSSAAYSHAWKLGTSIFAVGVQSNCGKMQQGFLPLQHSMVQCKSTRLELWRSGSDLQPAISIQGCFSLCLSFLFCNLMSLFLEDDLALQRPQEEKTLLTSNLKQELWVVSPLIQGVCLWGCFSGTSQSRSLIPHYRNLERLTLA